MIRHILCTSLLCFYLSGCASGKAALSGPAPSPLPVVRKFVEQYGALQSPTIDLYLQKLLQKLAAVAPQRTKIPFSVTLLDTAKPIAFTPGGGFIMVSTGLVKKLKSEHELLFVLAHEMAHDALEHTASENLYSNDPNTREALELQADQYALSLLAEAGIDPAAGSKALSHAAEALLEEQYSSARLTIETRKKAIEKLLMQLPPVGDPVDNSAFKSFRRSL